MTEPRAEIDLQTEPTRVLVFALNAQDWLQSGGGAALMHSARGDRAICVQVTAAKSDEEEKRIRASLGERFELRSLDLTAGELGGVHDLVARLGAVLDSVLLSDGADGARFVVHAPAPPAERLRPEDEDQAVLVAALASAMSHRAPQSLRVFGSPFAQRHYELSEEVLAQKLGLLKKLCGKKAKGEANESCSTLSSERWLERLMVSARVGHGPDAERSGQMRALGVRSGDAFPRATAVVSTWNKRDDVIANIESLRGQTLPFAEIVVVDNASSDGTAEAIAARFPEVRCVVMPHSEYGACETFNVGFANARTPLLAILDDDIVMSPSWLERATRRFAGEPDSTAIVSTKIVEPGMPDSYANSDALNTERYMSTFRGCASLARTDAIRAAGGYDERLFIYGNERDLTCRLLNAGQRVLQYPQAEVFHKTPFGIKMGKRSLYYHARNAFLSMLKYAPAKDLIKLPFLVVTKVLFRSKSAEAAGNVTDATGTIGIGRSLKETPGAWLVLLKAGSSVLWNIPYCLKRRQPVKSADFELPLE